MIKINLLRNRGAISPGAVGETQYTVAVDEMLSDESGQQKEALVKLILMGVVTGLIMFYESYNVGNIKRSMAAVNSQLTTLKSELTAKTNEANQGAQTEQAAKELEEKLMILKKLSKIRLREVKAMDFLQNIIPERAWLKSVQYEKDRFVIAGFALTDDDMSELVKSLENSVYFSNVILLQAREEQSKDGTLKTFELSCNVETVE